MDVSQAKRNKATVCALPSIHLPLTREASVMVQARDGAVLGGLVQAKDGGEAIPPVVARIFSGDSTSPLTRGGKNVVRSKGG